MLYIALVILGLDILYDMFLETLRFQEADVFAKQTSEARTNIVS